VGRLELVVRGTPVAAEVLAWEPGAAELGLAIAVEDGETLGDGLRVLSTIADSGRTVARVVAETAEARARLWLASREDPPALRRATVDPANAPRVPLRGQRTPAARLQRLAWLREQTGAALAPLEETRLDPEALKNNVEVMIGAVEVPVGLAGPLLFVGEQVDGWQYAPLATTEGAIVASCARGAMALSRAGGVRTRVLGRRMSRVPTFVLADRASAHRLAQWIADHAGELRARTPDLIGLEAAPVGALLHVEFVFARGDASAHQTTARTFQTCQHIVDAVRALGPEVRLERFVVEGGLSGDKKVNQRALFRGRGLRVLAECELDADTLRYVLDVGVEPFLALFASAMAVAHRAGMVGHNLNVANVVGAMFVATGQDLGCIHESSVGFSTAQPTADGVHVTLELPCLVVDSDGGGTVLPAQRALLEMMGCAGPEKESRLAELIAGFCLGIELATAAAVISGGFGGTHERLAR
jgi:hydroxymethylglutaryl-CoA reductase (NADPH)